MGQNNDALWTFEVPTMIIELLCNLDSKKQLRTFVLLVNTIYVFPNNVHYLCEQWIVVCYLKLVAYVLK